MIILSWNVRGLHRASKKSFVKRFVVSRGIHCFCLLETKLISSGLSHFANNYFPNWKMVNNSDQDPKGRMAIFWNPAFLSFEDIKIMDQSIHCEVRCCITHLRFNVSFVYAKYCVVTRRLLWDWLANWVPNTSMPWVVLGDFNCVCDHTETVGYVDSGDYFFHDIRQFRTTLCLDDAPSIGSRFTWNRGEKWAKLDRVLINPDWNANGIDCRAEFCDMNVESDHCPVLFSFGQELVGRGVSPFKFFNMWIKHPSFRDIVKDSWEVDVMGTKQFQLISKLKRLKGPLRRLNKKEFGSISVRVEEAKEDFKHHLDLLVSDPSNSHLIQLVAEKRKKATFLLDAEMSFYQQRAKCQFFLEADKCTKFFHSVVTKNRAMRAITSLLRSDGSRTSSIPEVADEFVGFYSELFGSSSSVDPLDLDVLQSGPLVSHESASALIAEISDDEIRSALFDIGNEKAPGPDGYSSAFFKSQWSLIGGDLIAAVREFFSSGRLLKQLSHSTIALIPKSTHDPTVRDFRPIACLNVVYKVITKILASRMSSMLSDLIDPAQAGFVAGRSMFDNIYLAQELVRGYADKKQAARCMFMLDITKAYDTVSWDFLESSLRGLGFPDRFVGWVMECVTTATYSISLHGGLHGFFRGRRGVRQGDPMSPSLFILCLEYLSRLIRIRTLESGFQYHGRCAGLGITHLAFADDVMLFCRGDVRSVEILMDCLHDFSAVSGLAISPEKSKIFISEGVRQRVRDEIIAIVQHPVGTLPVRYLGVPLTSQRASSSDFEPLIQRIDGYIRAWNQKSLSSAGRVELIRAVVEGVQSFWLRAFPIYDSVIGQITSLCRAFLWGSKFNKVAWSDICKPKAEGGLGLKHVATWNKALLAKVLWDIHSEKNSLWVRWIHEEYLRGRSVWEWQPRARDSRLFKVLASIRDLILDRAGGVDGVVTFLASVTVMGKLNSGKLYHTFRVKNPPKPWMEFIWRNHIPPRYSFVAWLAFRGRLPTKKGLAFIDMERDCTLCGNGEESTPHLFFHCSVSRSIWDSVRLWLGMGAQLSSLARAERTIRKTHRLPSVRLKAWRLAFISTVYHIWKARNELCFQGGSLSSIAVVLKVKASVYRILYKLYPVDSIDF